MIRNVTPYHDRSRSRARIGRPVQDAPKSRAHAKLGVIPLRLLVPAPSEPRAGRLLLRMRDVTKVTSHARLAKVASSIMRRSLATLLSNSHQTAAGSLRAACCIRRARDVSVTYSCRLLLAPGGITGSCTGGRRGANRHRKSMANEGRSTGLVTSSGTLTNARRATSRG